MFHLKSSSILVPAKISQDVGDAVISLNWLAASVDVEALPCISYGAGLPRYHANSCFDPVHIGYMFLMQSDSD